MKTKNYRILVLSDLGDSAMNILENTTRLAKMIGGEVAFFHAEQPSKVVKQDNQLSAVRSINAAYVETKKRIEKLVAPVSKAFGKKIDTIFVVGNIREEISKQIETFQPDIIVMGQRKQSPLKLIGDSITQQVLTNFVGIVMIASHDQVLGESQELSLGMFNGTGECLKTALAVELLEQTSQPLKSFKIATKKTSSEQALLNTDKKIVEYHFSNGDSVLNTISKYLSKTKVDVLFVNQQETTQTNMGIKDVIGKFNVPLLLTGKYSHQLNNQR
ncbi:MAG: universal stress protein [Muricauda sp.]|nr:universal stress protein [Allomuricauda sp.]